MMRHDTTRVCENTRYLDVRLSVTANFALEGSHASVRHGAVFRVGGHQMGFRPEKFCNIIK